MTQYLKLFPGDKDFREVSQREWNRGYEFGDQNGWGNILGLSADVRVWDRPGGKLLVARKWPARSFIRNFARMVRMMFQTADIALLDTAGGNILTNMNQVSSVGSASLMGQRTLNRTYGAGMAVGDGAGSEDHQRNDLISRIGNIVLANESVATTVDDTTTMTLQITQGVTIAQSGGITAREIGMYLFIRPKAGTKDDDGTPTLMAYDQITPTAVAQGGVISPRYTLNFPV